MDIPKIHEGEYRFCLIMWEHEPVTAVELVKLKNRIVEIISHLSDDWKNKERKRV